MPENYAEGHPLRKDFPLRGRFTRAEQTRRALAMAVEDFYIPSELDVVEQARRHAEAMGTAGSTASAAHTASASAPSAMDVAAAGTESAASTADAEEAP